MQPVQRKENKDLWVWPHGVVTRCTDGGGRQAEGLDEVGKWREHVPTNLLCSVTQRGGRELQGVGLREFGASQFI